MTDEEEIDYLWGLALGKKSGWQYSDFPVVKDKLPKFAEAWKKSKKKTQYKTGKSVDVWMVEQYWVAEARQRNLDRQKGGKISQPVGATVWLNDERWNNGVETEVRTEEAKAGVKCKCGQPTHGPKFDECQTCMGYKEGKLATPYADLLRDYYKRHQINYDQLKDLSPMRQVQVIKQLLSGNKNILLDK